MSTNHCRRAVLFMRELCPRQSRFATPRYPSWRVTMKVMYQICGGVFVVTRVS